MVTLAKQDSWPRRPKTKQTLQKTAREQVLKYLRPICCVRAVQQPSSRSGVPTQAAGPTKHNALCGSLPVAFSATSKSKSDADCGVFAAAAPHTTLSPLPACRTYRPPPLHSLANNFRVCLWAGHVAHMATMRIT
jgi:hypothetical protein